eukprot:UN29351
MLGVSEGIPIMWRLQLHHLENIAYGSLFLLTSIACHLSYKDTKYHLLKGLNHEESRPDNIDLNGRLVGLLGNAMKYDGNLEYYCAVIIRELCSYPEMKELLMDMNVLNVVFKLMQSENIQTMELALSSLGDMLLLEKGMKQLLALDGCDSEDKIDTMELLQYGLIQLAP